jgi:hypothetical protein
VQEGAARKPAQRPYCGQLCAHQRPDPTGRHDSRGDSRSGRGDEPAKRPSSPPARMLSFGERLVSTAFEELVPKATKPHALAGWAKSPTEQGRQSK